MFVTSITVSLESGIILEEGGEYSTTATYCCRNCYRSKLSKVTLASGFLYVYNSTHTLFLIFFYK